jgi:hypothetical protein
MGSTSSVFLKKAKLLFFIFKIYISPMFANLSILTIKVNKFEK